MQRQDGVGCGLAQQEPAAPARRTERANVDPGSGKRPPEQDPGAATVPPRRDGDHLFGPELSGETRDVHRGLGGHAGAVVAEDPVGAPGPGFQHQLGLRSPAEQDGVLLGGELGRSEHPRLAYGMQACAAPGRVAEDDDQPHERLFIQR